MTPASNADNAATMMNEEIKTTNAVAKAASNVQENHQKKNLPVERSKKTLRIDFHAPESKVQFSVLQSHH